MGATRDALKEISATLARFKTAMAGPENPELSLAIELLADHFERIRRTRDEGQPLVWQNFGMFPEVFWAMDLPPAVVEVVNGIVAPAEDALRYIDLAEVHIPDYLCSSNKLFLGAILSGELPVPDLLVVPSQPCDSNLSTYPAIARTFDFPYFCVDLPYFRNEKGIDYVTGQLRELIGFLEEKTGRKLEYERLRQAMEYSNAAHEYALRLNELRRAVPCPYSSLDNLAEYPLMLCLAGTDRLVDYYKTRYETTRARVDRGEGHLTPEQEKIRMAWIYGAPAFDLFLFMMLEQQYGAVAVANMNNNFVMRPVADISTIDSILRGLAEKITLMPMTRECGGPWENYLNASIDLCRRNKAHCAVFAGHVACKANWAVIKLVKDKLSEELGIPIMIIEMDLFDPRILSSTSLSAQFDDFFNVFLKDRLA